MNEKLKSMMSSKITRIVSIAACTALVLSIGTMSAFAAANAAKNLVKNENGVISNSTDDGATWQNGAPAGMTQIVNDDGSMLSYVGNPPDGSANSFAIKQEDGVTYFSTDGGATWSDEAPAGYTQNADGSVSYGFGSGGASMAGGSLVKNEDGVAKYSNDSGATWQEGTPDGMTTINEDGFIRSYVGNPPDAGADSFAVRNEGGATYYSTDGGTTWSKDAPAGYTQNTDGSVSFRFGN